MRSPVTVMALALVLVPGILVPGTARAADPDPGLALFAGAGIQVAGFLLGGALLATSHSDPHQNNAGWLTIESGFTLAPLAAHAVEGEWGRGLVFAAVPGSALLTTGGLFVADPGAIERGGLPEQRWMWGIFGVGLFASAAGVVDAMFANHRSRRIYLQPAVGAGHVGFGIGGTL